MPNFRSLAHLEVPEKFVWGWVGGWFAKSFSCQTQPFCCVEVRVRVVVLTILITSDEANVLIPELKVETNIVEPPRDNNLDGSLDKILNNLEVDTKAKKELTDKLLLLRMWLLLVSRSPLLMDLLLKNLILTLLWY